MKSKTFFNTSKAILAVSFFCFITPSFSQNSLKTPKLIKPRNGSTLSKTVFKWRSVRKADAYRIVISQNRNFSGYTENAGNSHCDGTCFTKAFRKTSYKVNNFNRKGHTYYWKIRAGGRHGASDWSKVYKFKTKGSPSSGGNSGKVVHPMPSGRVLSNGKCINGSLCDGGRGRHRGVDLMGKKGTRVKSMCKGKVVLNFTNRRIREAFLVIKHNCKGRTYYGYYGHLKSSLKANQKVRAGQEIGKIRHYPVNGTHLHMAVSPSYHSQGWGYGPKEDFIDFRTLL